MGRLRSGETLLYVCDSTDGRLDGGNTNGVKRTQQNITKALVNQGFSVNVLHAGVTSDLNPATPLFPSTAELPGYPELKFALNPLPSIGYIQRLRPDGIFVATTEGPIGFATALACNWPHLLGETRRIPYTASFTTRIDLHISELSRQWVSSLLEKTPLWAKPLIDVLAVKPWAMAPFVRWLYNSPDKVLIPTMTTMKELASMGVDVHRRGVLWPRGIDTNMFRPPKEQEKNPYRQYGWYYTDPRPIVIFFGRVSAEKNIQAFLSANLPAYHCVVIGDGPFLPELKQQYPKAHFLGMKHGEDLAAHVRWAQVHVFPSKTDTFGNTLLEAGASGVPSVGFAGVAGPQDVLKENVSGILIQSPQELPLAVARAAQLDRTACARDIVSRYSWETSAKTLIQNVPRIRWRTR